MCVCLSASWRSGQGGLTMVAAQLDDGRGPESVCPAHVAEFVCIFAAFYARHALIFAVYSEAPGCVASQVKRSCTLHLIEEMCPRVHKTMLCRNMRGTLVKKSALPQVTVDDGVEDGKEIWVYQCRHLCRTSHAPLRACLQSASPHTAPALDPGGSGAQQKRQGLAAWKEIEGPRVEWAF